MQATVSALAGGATGFVVMALADPAQRSTHLDIWVIAIGALLGILLYTAFTSPS
jgi:hypothetical protein